MKATSQAGSQRKDERSRISDRWAKTWRREGVNHIQTMATTPPIVGMRSCQLLPSWSPRFTLGSLMLPGTGRVISSELSEHTKFLRAVCPPCPGKGGIKGSPLSWPIWRVMGPERLKMTPRTRLHPQQRSLMALPKVSRLFLKAWEHHASYFQPGWREQRGEEFRKVFSFHLPQRQRCQHHQMWKNWNPLENYYLYSFQPKIW